MIQFTIPLQPITKKNHQQILKSAKTGRPFIMPSKQYREYEQAALWYIPKPKNAVIKPVNVKVMFFMGNERRCDLSNLLEAIDDIMVKAGLLPDDNYRVIRSHDGSRVFVDKDNPRTEVYIEDADMWDENYATFEERMKRIG